METFFLSSFILGISFACVMIGIYLVGKKKEKQMRDEWLEDWKIVVDHLLEGIKKMEDGLSPK